MNPKDFLLPGVVCAPLFVPIAQSAEQRAYIAFVAGSSPAGNISLSMNSANPNFKYEKTSY